MNDGDYAKHDDDARVWKVNGREVSISYVYPPIPTRIYDYQCTWDDYEPGDPMGYGPTARLALEDFKELVRAASEESSK